MSSIYFIDYDKFKSISEFKDAVSRGGEVEFEWNGKHYGVTHPLGKITIYEAYKPETEKVCGTVDDALDYLIDGQPLRNILTQVDITFRSL